MTQKHQDPLLLYASSYNNREDSTIATITLQYKNEKGNNHVIITMSDHLILICQDPSIDTLINYINNPTPSSSSMPNCVHEHRLSDRTFFFEKPLIHFHINNMLKELGFEDNDIGFITYHLNCMNERNYTTDILSYDHWQKIKYAHHLADREPVDIESNNCSVM